MLYFTKGPNDSGQHIKKCNKGEKVKQIKCFFSPMLPVSFLRKNSEHGLKLFYYD